MSERTEQITEACGKIAENQRKLYDKGYADGRASVKYIKFFVMGSDDIYEFSAFEGVTWREFVAFDAANSVFSIKDEKVFYTPNLWTELWLGCGEDDEIVGQGIYRGLLNILDDEYPFYIDFDWANAGKYIEMYNQDKYYVDDDGYVRTNDGRWFMASEAVGCYWATKATGWIDQHYAFKLSPDADVILFGVGYSDCITKRGHTWEEFINSVYSNGFYYVNGDSVKNQWDEIVQLNGVNVKPAEVIASGVDYESVYL